MKRIWLLLAALTVWAVWSAQADVSTRPGSTRPAASRPAEAEFPKLRQRAFEDLLAGKFKEGLSLLEKARASRPDKALTKARELTLAYLERRGKTQGERKAEYAAAVKRVRLAQLAQKHRPALVEAKLDKELYDHVAVIADAVVSTEKAFSGASNSQPEELREEMLEHLDKASEELGKMPESVAKAPPQWRRAYEGASKNCKAPLAAYRKAWQEAKLPADRRTLRLASEKAKDPLIDMRVLVHPEPMPTALTHAREAAALAEHRDTFFEKAWVRTLIAEAEKLGQKLVKEQQWDEALSLYGRSGLSGLDQDNVAYQETVKRISLRVRMIRLYGKARVPAATTKPTSAPAEKPRWMEMARGVDTAMVKNAISQVNSNYVETPDFRRMGLAGLEGVRTLVQTPEAADTVKELRDADKRKALVAGLDKLIARLKKEPIVDHLHVSQALDRALNLNAKTADLPAEVINMEFAESLTGELDKFTMMLWPYELDKFRMRTEGSFVGIGVQIRKDPTGTGPIEVVTPLADTPAIRAGILAGDWIVRVNGQDTKDMTLSRAVKLIKGPRHTAVTITIRRSGSPKPFDVVIVRDKINVRTVRGWRRMEGGEWDYLIDPEAGIGYIRLTQFTHETPADLRAALRRLRESKVGAIVLDLRFNPGGYLDEARIVTNEFLRRGLIVRTKGRNTPESKRVANAQGEFLDGKMVVLVNEYSASAAEIIAGALKDWGRARIVGERSYGKGTTQGLFNLKRSGEAQLKLTTGYYYLPSGACLHRTNGAKSWGVDPHLPVPATIRQTNRWAEIRQETDLIRKDADAGHLGTLLGFQLAEDIQLQTALLLLRLELLAQQV